MKHSPFFMIALLLPLSGCGRETAPEAKIVVELPPTKEELTKQEATENSKKKEDPRAKLVPLDLRSYGLFALVDAPADAKVERFCKTGSTVSVIRIVGADNYELTIAEGAVDLADLKKQLLKPRPKIKIHVDEPEALLMESDDAGLPAFRWETNVEIGGKPYRVSGESKFAAAELSQVRRNLEAAQGLRQTPALARAKKERDEAEAELRKLGVTFNKAEDGLQVLFVGMQAADDLDLERVSRIPDVTQIDLRTNGKWTAAGLQHLEALPRLSRLTIGGPWVNSAIVRKVSEWTTLRGLRIIDAPITDFDLRSLANLTELESLDLDNTRIGDAGVKNLLPLKKLVYLFLPRTDVTDKGLASIKEFTELDTLSLADTAITDAGLTELSGLRKLKRLYLAETVVTDAGMKTLTQMPWLTEIELYGTNVTAVGIKTPPFIRPWPVKEPDLEPIVPPVPVAQLPAANAVALVEKLGGKIKRDEDAEGDSKPIIGIDLAGKNVANIDLGHLRTSARLQNLNLENCPAITSAGLAYLAGLENLEELNLRGTQVTGDGLVFLKGMAKLRKLVLSPTTILTGKQLDLLSGLKNLEGIAFQLPEADHPALAALSRMGSLKILNLDGVVLTNRKMDYLKGLKKLEVLNLGHAGEISDRGIAVLKDMPKLEMLIVHNYRGSSRGGLAPLRNLENLKVLELGGPAISDASLDFAGSLPNLEQLRLDDTAIGDAALGSLRGLNKLLELRLRGTNVGDRGMDALSALKDLEILDLAYTKVTDKGLLKLKDLVELRSLRLDGTTVTGVCFKELDGLTKLRRLLLYGAKVNDAGLAEIARLTSLMLLDLGRTDITDRGLASLKPLRVLEEINLADCAFLTDNAVANLKSYRALKRVDLRGAKLSPAAMEELRKSGITVGGQR